jgi:heat shock protein HslJ
MRLPLLFVIVLLGITSACGADGDDETTIDDGSTVPPPQVDGTSWVLIAGDGTGGAVERIDGYPITLSFSGSQITGTAACNGYGGSYELDGIALAIGDLSQTEMACEPVEVMTAERSFLANLLDVSELTISGDELTLASSATELVFIGAAKVPQSELIGETWVLETLIQGETASSVQGDPATLVLNADGTFDGSTGCRAIAGDYVISGASVQFTSWGAEGECPPDLAAQDNLVVTVLGDGFGVEIDDDRLTVTSMGNEGLVYRAE